MNCEHVQMQWPEYVDGGLAAEDRRKLEAHIKTCAACVAALAGERDAMARFADLVNPGLQARRLSPEARARLAGMAPTRGGRAWARPAWEGTPWPRLLAVAATLLVLSVSIGVFRYTRNGCPSTETAQTQAGQSLTPPGLTNPLSESIVAVCMSNAQERLGVNTVYRVSL